MVVTGLGGYIWLKRKKGNDKTKSPKFHEIRDVIVNTMKTHSLNPRITIPKFEGQIYTLLA